VQIKLVVDIVQELRFRTWSEKQKKYLYFTLNDAVCQDAGFDATREQLIEETDRLNDQQFTGLHDLNGKEIWAGDIVDATVENSTVGVTGVVKALPGAFAIVQSPIHYYYLMRFDIFKIIGNIHENPEMVI
jgi:uncharacterized phage protein (TIGR01671 family)